MLGDRPFAERIGEDPHLEDLAVAVHIGGTQPFRDTSSKGNGRTFERTCSPVTEAMLAPSGLRREGCRRCGYRGDA